jgi:hypothetical protein
MFENIRKNMKHTQITLLVHIRIRKTQHFLHKLQKIKIFFKDNIKKNTYHVLYFNGKQEG